MSLYIYLCTFGWFWWWNYVHYKKKSSLFCRHFFFQNYYNVFTNFFNWQEFKVIWRSCNREH